MRNFSELKSSLLQAQGVSERFTYFGETVTVRPDFSVYINEKLLSNAESLQEAVDTAKSYIDTIRSSKSLTESMLLNKKYITLNSGEVMAIDESTDQSIEFVKSNDEDKYKTILESKDSFKLFVKELRKANV